MTLIPIEHERRLGSPAEPEAFFRAVRAWHRNDRVSVRGLHTTDPTRMASVIDALRSDREHTLSFEGGSLRLAADTLRPFVHAPLSYFDLRSGTAALRIWPGRIWVHATHDLPACSSRLGVPLMQGQNRVRDFTVTIAEGGGWPFDAAGTNVDTALHLFEALTEDVVRRGFVSGVSAEAKAPLLALVTSLGTRTDAVLDVDVATARELTELFAGEALDWQREGLLVDFPAGRIHGFLTTPNTSESDRKVWQARVDTILRRAQFEP